MKTPLLLALLLLTLSATLASAQDGPPAHAAIGERAALVEGDEVAALEYVLSMSDSELDQLQSAIARVRSMKRDERTALRAKILEYRKLPESQRARLREGWGWQSEKDRNDWRAMMQMKTDAERESIHADLQACPPEKRSERKHALLEQWRSSGHR